MLLLSHLHPNAQLRAADSASDQMRKILRHKHFRNNLIVLYPYQQGLTDIN